ncbi:MAG TPA: NDP-sugar synthase, partial [Actinomycetota bacterium]|nr:NDP-sugar synthase [Actinomycetota bacterium]
MIGASNDARSVRPQAPIIVNVARNGDFVQAALAPFENDRVEFISELPDPPGGAGTVAGLKDRDFDLLVTRNADHLVRGLDLRGLVSAHEQSGAAMTIVVRVVPEGADVEMADGRAVGLIDRRADRGAPGGLWIGTSVISKSALELIPERRPIDLTAGLLAPLIERGEVAVHQHRDYELDVGTPARYLQACIDLMRRRTPYPPRRVRGSLLEAAGTLAYVGADAEVDEMSIGGDAIILGAAHVPPRCYVTHAIVMPGERLTPGLRLEDAVFFDGRAIPI